MTQGGGQRWQASPVKPAGHEQLPYKANHTHAQLAICSACKYIVTVTNTNITTFHIAMCSSITSGLVNPCSCTWTKTCVVACNNRPYSLARPVSHGRSSQRSEPSRRHICIHSQPCTRHGRCIDLGRMESHDIPRKKLKLLQ